jgi:hypothetical protein
MPGPIVPVQLRPLVGQAERQGIAMAPARALLRKPSQGLDAGFDRRAVRAAAASPAATQLFAP